jgi:hypothetical protein
VRTDTHSHRDGGSSIFRENPPRPLLSDNLIVGVGVPLTDTQWARSNLIVLVEGLVWGWWGGLRLVAGDDR